VTLRAGNQSVTTSAPGEMESRSRPIARGRQAPAANSASRLNWSGPRTRARAAGSLSN